MISVLVEMEEPNPHSPAMSGAALLDGLGLSVNVDHSFRPVTMAPSVPLASIPAVAFGGPNVQTPRATIVVRAEAPSLDAANDLLRVPGVVGVWSDPEITWFQRPGVDLKINPVVFKATPLGVDCASNTSTGTHQGVAELIGAPRLWNDGFRGQGVVIGIVDGGVNKAWVPR